LKDYAPNFLLPVRKLVADYLESKDMKFTFVREINFRNLNGRRPGEYINLNPDPEGVAVAFGHILLYQKKQGGDNDITHNVLFKRHNR
jgi:hypothetical protein